MTHTHPDQQPPVLAFVDTETTGLNPRIHQPYEVCVWREDHPTPTTLALAHTLDHADPRALQIGRYFERGFTPHRAIPDEVADELLHLLRGTTLVGSNPSFDAAMLARFLGIEVWSHRLIDVSQAAMWVLGHDRPRGLAVVADELRAAGFQIPAPDHTATGDVRTTRVVYEALDALRPTAPAAIWASGVRS